MKDSIYVDYMVFLEELQKKHGEHTILLMQNGYMFELYDVTDGSIQMSACKEILSMSPFCSNHHTLNGKNIFKVGFPIESFTRNTKKLVKNGFTVAKMVYKNGVRQIEQILSPGCNMCEDDDVTQSILVAALFTESDDNVSISCARFDMNIGRIEYVSRTSYTMLESMKICKDLIYEMGDISELDIYYKGSNFDDFKSLCKFEILSLHIHDMVCEKRLNVFDQRFQIYFFENVFKQYLYMGGSILKTLNLEASNNNERVIILLLIMFIRAHDENNIHNISIPKLYESDNNKVVTCINSLFERMDMFTPRFGMFAMLNLSKTRMGERLFRNIIRTPIFDTNILEDRYTMIDSFSRMNLELKKQVSLNLGKYSDLDRLQRKFGLEKCSPVDMYKLYMNFSHAHKLHMLIGYFDVEDDTVEEAILMISSTFELKRLKNNEYAILQHVDAAVDGFKSHLQSLRQRIDGLLLYFNDIIGKDVVKIVETHDEINLQLTCSKAKQLEQMITEGHLTSETFTFIDCKKYTIIRGSFDECLYEYIDIKNKLLDASKRVFNIVVKKVHMLTRTISEGLSTSIAKIDVFFSLAQYFTANSYTRPRLTTASGTIKAKQLRHPIIQKLVTDNGKAYVSNDVSLSPANSWLLYGVNSVGKSSLLKSIIINAILAQCGLFVAADDFEICPFQNIGCRIGNMDDIYLGQSSFVKELVEMNTILSKAEGSNTLIVTDEICSSTERKSAINVFASFVQIMTEKQMTFACSTHLFELQQNRYIKGLSSIRNMHLKVRIEQGVLFFDRILQDGVPTADNYGIKVADAVLWDHRFKTLIKSKWHDEEEVPEDVNMSESSYNCKSIRIMCEICGYYPKCVTDQRLHTHHIQFQCTYGNAGKSIEHKNKNCNLVTLCPDCHRRVHSYEIEIRGYQDTSKGTILDFSKKNCC